MPTNLRLLDYPSPPRAYRVLHLAADGRVLMALPIPAESDLEALTMAETLKGECAVELWDGLRFIEHFAPMVRDVVIAGEGRSELAALVFPAAGFSQNVFDGKRRTLEGTGSSNTIRRILILDEPPSLDAGEITDKGTINQKAVLQRRAALVEKLYR